MERLGGASSFKIDEASYPPPENEKTAVIDI
jgi:hypothetical protein